MNPFLHHCADTVRISGKWINCLVCFGWGEGFTHDWAALLINNGYLVHLYTTQAGVSKEFKHCMFKWALYIKDVLWLMKAMWPTQWLLFGEIFVCLYLVLCCNLFYVQLVNWPQLCRLETWEFEFAGGVTGVVVNCFTTPSKCGWMSHLSRSQVHTLYMSTSHHVHPNLSSSHFHTHPHTNKVHKKTHGEHCNLGALSSALGVRKKQKMKGIRCGKGREKEGGWRNNKCGWWRNYVQVPEKV